jgi:hypothetical protein
MANLVSGIGDAEALLFSTEGSRLANPFLHTLHPNGLCGAG